MKFLCMLAVWTHKFPFKKIPRKAACKVFFQSQQRCSFDQISFLRFYLLFPPWKEYYICFGIEKAPQICFKCGHHCLDTYNIYFHLNLLKLPLLYVKYICQWIKNLLLWNCVFFPDHANLSVFFKGPPPDNIFKIFCFAQIGRRGEKQGVKVEESTRVSKV